MKTVVMGSLFICKGREQKKNSWSIGIQTNLNIVNSDLEKQLL